MSRGALPCISALTRNDSVPQVASGRATGLVDHAARFNSLGGSLPSTGVTFVRRTYRGGMPLTIPGQLTLRGSCAILATPIHFFALDPRCIFR